MKLKDIKLFNSIKWGKSEEKYFNIENNQNGYMKRVGLEMTLIAKDGVIKLTGQDKNSGMKYETYTTLNNVVQLTPLNSSDKKEQTAVKSSDKKEPTKKGFFS